MNNNASLEQSQHPPPKKNSFLLLSKYPVATRPSLVLAPWLVGPRACTDCITSPAPWAPGQAAGTGPPPQRGRSHLPVRASLWVVLGGLLAGVGGETLSVALTSLPGVPGREEAAGASQEVGWGCVFMEPQAGGPEGCSAALN